MSGGWARPPASAADRGYGAGHQQQRAALKPAVDAGRAMCAEIICLEQSRRIEPGTPWDLAHTPERDSYRGPAHARCNQNEAARRGGATSGAQAARRAALKHRPPEPHPGLLSREEAE
jgi:hypothetical protein